MEKYMIIDGERVAFTDEKNILAVIRKAGIILPTFCYYSDLSIYGACRMCGGPVGRHYRILFHTAETRDGNPHQHTSALLSQKTYSGTAVSGSLPGLYHL